MSLIGNKVKLFLINSLSAEGEVEYWGDDKVVLISNNKKLIINNPQQNIIMYYAFDPIVQKSIESTIQNPVSKKEYFWEVKEPEEDSSLKDSNLRFKKLAELKIMSAEAQRDQIKRELTTFKPVNTDNILGKYGTPSFIIPQHDSSEEIKPRNANDTGGMPEVSRKNIK